MEVQSPKEVQALFSRNMYKSSLESVCRISRIVQNVAGQSRQSNLIVQVKLLHWIISYGDVHWLDEATVFGWAGEVSLAVYTETKDNHYWTLEKRQIWARNCVCCLIDMWVLTSHRSCRAARRTARRSRAPWRPPAARCTARWRGASAVAGRALRTLRPQARLLLAWTLTKQKGIKKMLLAGIILN